MYCRNCGKELNEGAVFCPYCGTKTGNDTPVPAEPQNTAPAEPSVPKKSHKALIAVIASIAAVLLIAGGIFAFLMISSKNKAINEFTEYVEQFEKIPSQYTSLGKYQKKYNNLLSDAKDLINNESTEQMTSAREDMEKLAQDIKALSDIIAAFSVSKKAAIDSIEGSGNTYYGKYAEAYNSLKTLYDTAISEADTDKCSACQVELDEIKDNIDLARKVNARAEAFQSSTSAFEQEITNFGIYRELYDNLKKEYENAVAEDNFDRCYYLEKDYEELCEKIRQAQNTEAYRLTLNEITDEIEKSGKYFLDIYSEAYYNIKDSLADAIIMLDEESSSYYAGEFTEIAAQIEAYDKETVEGYASAIEADSKNSSFSSYEKYALKQYKKELDKLITDEKWLDASQLYSEYSTQAALFTQKNNISFDFSQFTQMDVSKRNTVRLYYPDDASIDWDAGCFTLLEKSSSGKKWTTADILSLKQVDGELTIDLVADISSSMNWQFSSMQNAMCNFIGYTDSDTTLGLSTIGTVYERIQNFTKDKSAISSNIRNLSCWGLTSLYQSLYSSVLYTATASGARCVVAFTDGMNEPYGTGYDFNVDDVITVAQRYNVPVYIVALGSSVDVTSLKRIANSTGGSFYENYSASDLYNIYCEIYAKQQSLYELTYKSSLKNEETRSIYLSYNSSKYNQVFKTEFKFDPTDIISGYTNLTSGTNLINFYTDRRYLTTEEISSVSSIQDLQTLINIYCAKNGYQFQNESVLSQMMSLGALTRNGTLNSDQTTKKLKENPVIWANYSAIYNARYEWVYRVTRDIYYSYGGYISQDELSELVHQRLNESQKNRFIYDVKKAYKALSGN